MANSLGNSLGIFFTASYTPSPRHRQKRRILRISTERIGGNGHEHLSLAFPKLELHFRRRLITLVALEQWQPFSVGDLLF